MSRIHDFERQNPGWTLKIKACGHFESEQLQTTTYPTYVPGASFTYVVGVPPMPCRFCTLKKQILDEQWKQLKEEMENG